MGTRTGTGIVAAAAVLALVTSGAALLTACGGGGGSEEATVRLSPEPGGTTTVEAGVGDTVVLDLEANATTGYEWTFTAGDTFIIEKSEYVPDENPEQLAGRGGTQVVTLRVTEAGESRLTGTYARSWETPSPDAQPDLVVTVRTLE